MSERVRLGDDGLLELIHWSIIFLNVIREVWWSVKPWRLLASHCRWLWWIYLSRLHAKLTEVTCSWRRKICHKHMTVAFFFPHHFSMNRFAEGTFKVTHLFLLHNLRHITCFYLPTRPDKVEPEQQNHNFSLASLFRKLLEQHIFSKGRTQSFLKK